MKIIRELLAELKRSNDLKEKEIDFKKLVVFDDVGVSGLPPIKTQTKYKNIVYVPWFQK